jgi:uncharacterized integral membrane protein
LTLWNRKAVSAVIPDPIPTREGFPRVSARVESRRRRLAPHSQRVGLYTWACSLVALLVVLIALITANTGAVKLDWVVGSAHASLVWIILASAVLGWLLGIATGMAVRHRTRRRA